MAGARLRRRTVVAGAPALLVACSSGNTGGDDAGQPAAATSPSPDELDLADWEVVRAQFALDPELAHFAAYVLASHPAPVRAAVQRWRDAFDADPAAAVAGELARDASLTPYRETYVRFGTSIVTTPEQVDAAVEAVDELTR
ncbi:hypothetical protein [Jiangella muralis]|uniref:hypothetical protein n=1 Tax=Jiangella muralis TaxID=702383 RepID=UPI00069F4D47|nr:hypothetical protein [Jiangella muralis]